jgi:hypothetical protein
MTNKARLIKKGEYQQALERQAEKQANLRMATIENVRHWVREKCSPEPLSPRQKFAALFAEPQADWASK